MKEKREMVERKSTEHGREMEEKWSRNVREIARNFREMVDKCLEEWSRNGRETLRNGREKVEKFGEIVWKWSRNGREMVKKRWRK